MVELEDLTSLDLLIWLHRGELAAQRLNCSQSSISRRVNYCMQLFGTEINRINGEYQVGGHTQLLELERRIHQLYRLLKGHDLRLEADNWLAPFFVTPAPKGWITGLYDSITHHRPVELMRSRVIDAYLTSLKIEFPLPNDSDWILFDICRMPWSLMADRQHPLAQEKGLKLHDVARFPKLTLPEGILPGTEIALKQRFLWDDPVSISRYRSEDWDGRTADRASLIYGFTFTELLKPELNAIDFPLNLEAGVVLVVHREVAEQGAIQQLVDLLRNQASRLRRNNPCLQI